MPYHLLQKLTVHFTVIIGLFLHHALWIQSAHADVSMKIKADGQNANLLVRNRRIMLKADPVNRQAINEAIYDDINKTLYMIDHQNRTLLPITEKDINQLGGTLNTAVDMVQKQLESMSPEQQTKMKGMLQGLGLSVPEQKRFQPFLCNKLAHKTILAFVAINIVFFEGEQLLGQVCISAGNSTPLSTNDYQTIFNAQSFILNMAKKGKVFAQQYGHTLPNFGALHLDGLIVNSQQTKAPTSGAAASFNITDIDLNQIDDIKLPEDYQTRSLLQY